MSLVIAVGVAGCGDETVPSARPANAPVAQAAQPDAARKYLLERVDDAAVVQLYADGFTDLPLDQKTLIWHLYQAAIAGRDIYYDQRYGHNLEMRDVLEEILTHADGVDPVTRAELERYTSCSGGTRAVHPDRTQFVVKTPRQFARGRAAQRRGAKFRGSRANARPLFEADARSSSTATFGSHQNKKTGQARTSWRRAPTTSMSAPR